MSKKEDNYGADSIIVLGEVEKVRRKAGVYIGNTNIIGLHHLAYEIISNSIDECINGFGNKIYIRLIDKNTLEIEDFGRGIPFGINKKLKKEVLELNFMTLHAGAKIDNTVEGGAYKTSGGTNGLGVAITNFLSTDLYVKSYKVGEEAELIFKDQKTKGTIIKKNKSKRTGTIVRFSPDLSIFKGVKGFDPSMLIDKIKNQVYLEKITMIFEDKVNDETFVFENKEGISKFITDYNKREKIEIKDDEEIVKKEITPLTQIFVGEGLIEKNKETKGGGGGQTLIIDFALEFTNEQKSIIKGFTNSIFNPNGGEHVKGFRNAIYKGVKGLLQYQGQQGEKLLKDITTDDVLSNIIGLISVKMTDPEFEAQIKNELTSTYVKSLIEKRISREITKLFTPKDVESLMKSISLRINSRLKLESDELKIVAALNEKELQKKLPSKLTDAVNKDRSKTELFIVEGDSAGGNIKEERNPQIHSIMPLRGKLINVLKTTKEKDSTNQEINNLIYAISGGNIGKDFDIKKHLRYGKIILLSDADVDGLHISMLVLGFFIKYYYELIEKGHIYIGNAPLFSCSYKEDVKYFYTEQDKDNFISTKDGKKYKVSRFKGLGEMSAPELGLTALNPRYRSLHKVTVKDDSIAYIKDLMKTPETKFELIQDYQQVFLDKLENDMMGLKDKSKELIDIMKDNAIQYALEVNIDRAIPYIEDGLKNVNRRTLYCLKKDLNSTGNGEFIKSAKIVGSVIADYHAHGDCLKGDTKIFLLNGKHKTLKELYEIGEDQEILTYNEKDNKIESGVASNFRIGQYSTLNYIITLNNGEQIESTGNHPFLVKGNNKDEWINAENLEENMILESKELVTDSKGYITIGGKLLHSQLKERENDNNIIHHNNGIKTDNSNENLIELSRSEHALEHKENYLLGLENGRYNMFNDNGIYRDETKLRNKRLKIINNQIHGIRTAVKYIEWLKNNNKILTEENYIKYRKKSICNLYNVPLLHKIKTKYSLDNIFVDIYKIEINIGEIYKEQYGNKEKKIISKVKVNCCQNNINLLLNSGKLVIIELLHNKMDITEENYELARLELIKKFGLGYHNIKGREYTSLSTIYKYFNTFNNFLINLSKKLTFIVKIEKVKVDNIPMYDFTVNGTENLYIITKNKSNNIFNLVCVHNSSVYEAMVNLIQTFRQNEQLVEGHGAYGSIFAPDGVGAHRYTKARIGTFSEDSLLQNINKKPVPFVPNFSNTLEEPVVLPASLPVAIVMGDSGTGYGMAHQSIQHNTREVIDATIAYLSKKKRDKYEASDYIKGPDLPTGLYITNTQKEIKEIYSNPRGGQFKFRVPIESATYNKENGLLISSIASNGFNVEHLFGKLKFLLEERELIGIKKIVDLSGGSKASTKKGLKIFLSIDNKIKKEFIIENLYKKVKYGKGSGLEYKISYSPLYVNRYKELKYYTLNEMIKTFIIFRRETVTEVLKYDIEKIDRDIILTNNKILFALNIDKIVKIIKENNTRNIIKKKIIEAFPKSKLTDDDAEIIIETKLIQIKDLKALESTLKQKEREKKRLEDILANPKKLDKMLIEELEGLKKKYKNRNRKTKFLTLKDIKKIEESRETFNKYEKELKLAELLKPNYIYIDDYGFITRDTAVQESTVKKNLDILLVEKEKKKITKMFSNINNNSGTLYALLDTNKGHYIHVKALPPKMVNLPLNKSLPGYKGGSIMSVVYVDKEDNKHNLDNIVIYEDKKGNIGGFRIKSNDIAKTRQGFTLFGNGNKMLACVSSDKIDLEKDIEDVNLDNYKNVRKTEYILTDFPVKKSFSSGKILLKKK